MKKIAVVFCVFFSFTGVATAQIARRTVTNADLEKFAEQRLAAEREYREMYAAKGMLSPEELKARNDARIKDTIDLANKLQSEEIERQRLAVIESTAELQAQQLAVQAATPIYYPYDGGILSVGVFGDGGFGRGFHSRRFFPFFNSGFGRGVYAAGGNIWPAPVGQRSLRPQPLFRTVRGSAGGGGRRR
ncbi:MAG TPA: hypothetical protein VEV84_06010 [Pyrinomonadaceae bacterium]|nr:hypothetical protein [Pyrinomonadaceae bacterium]